MSKLSTVEFAGKSGNKYNFTVYTIDEECADEGGVYMFNERFKAMNGNFSHRVKYIGMAQSFVNRMYNHHKLDCAKKNGANCLCLHREDDEKKRTEIELDLLNNFNTSCNEVNN